VFAADWQLIWWNRGWAALVGDPSSTPPTLRNFARDTFPINDDSPRVSRWPVTTLGPDTIEAAIASDLRRATGHFPNNSRLTNLIHELTMGNQRFAELWATGAVNAHREQQKIIEHPAVGPITVDCDVMTDGDAELKIVILTAAPDTDDETKLRLAIMSNVPDTRSWLSRTGEP
jgi:hypothetical protein